MTPREARTDKEICELKRDHIDFPEWWFMIEENQAVVCRQASGEKAKGSLTIPRKVFDQMINWYNTGSKKARPAHE